MERLYVQIELWARMAAPGAQIHAGLHSLPSGSSARCKFEQVAWARVGDGTFWPQFKANYCLRDPSWGCWSNVPSQCHCHRSISPLEERKGRELHGWGSHTLKISISIAGALVVLQSKGYDPSFPYMTLSVLSVLYSGVTPSLMVYLPQIISSQPYHN